MVSDYTEELNPKGL